MTRRSRREFLTQIGGAMLAAGVGPQLAADLGALPAWAEEAAARLDFGAREALVGLLQDTPPEQLMGKLVDQLRAGTDLQTLLAAGALANARTFGGHDYIGFHTFMALGPAGQMARQLPTDVSALPVLKVLYRNTARMQAFGGRAAEVLHPLDAVPARPSGDGASLAAAVHRLDVDAAEKTLAALVAGNALEGYNALQPIVEEEDDVHRVVLAWRAWETLDLTGMEHAQTLLRQSVRYCWQVEKRLQENQRPVNPIRALLPQLLDQHRLLSKPVGDRPADDAWIAEFSRTIFSASKSQAAEAAAAALAEGFSPAALGEALSLAATQLVLHDPGRPERWASAEKPVGSVHGDSVGVHASDAANAWRNIAAVTNPRNTVASLILAAYHTAGQSQWVKPELFAPTEVSAELAQLDGPALLRETEAAIGAQDQARALQLVQRYGALNLPHQPVFQLLLRHSVRADGALHAEKYYATVFSEFARTRPAFRWQHLAALARVVASEAGRPAPGLAQAQELLGVKEL